MYIHKLVVTLYMCVYVYIYTYIVYLHVYSICSTAALGNVDQITMISLRQSPSARCAI